MSLGFLFGCKYMMIFSKELQKSDENHVKQNANVCIVAQSVWEHNFGGGGKLSAWYIEKYKRKCNLHTFAYETLFFYVILLGN